VKLIFLAASKRAQLMQRPSAKGNPIEKTTPPHFLHLCEAFISIRMITYCLADYKEEIKRLILASQLPQNSLLFKSFAENLSTP
jgi:hypothetical protein